MAGKGCFQDAGTGQSTTGMTPFTRQGMAASRRPASNVQRGAAAADVVRARTGPRRPNQFWLFVRGRAPRTGPARGRAADRHTGHTRRPVDPRSTE